MYPIMGGQRFGLTDFAKSLQEAFRMMEAVEASKRQREIFRQHQEGYAGRAVSGPAMAEAEQLMNAWDDAPPLEAQQAWTQKWGMPWSTVSPRFRTAERRTVQRGERADIERGYASVQANLLASLKAINSDPTLSPEQKSAYSRVAIEQATSRFSFAEQNPDVATDPVAMAMSGRAKAGILKTPILSTGKLPALPPAPTLPAMPAPGTGAGGFNPIPGQEIDPEDVMLMQEIYKEVKRRKTGAMGSAPTAPTWSPPRDPFAQSPAPWMQYFGGSVPKY